MNTRQKIMLVAGVVSLGVVSQTVWAITIASPVMPGDVFAVSSFGEQLLQLRSGSVASVNTTQLGGVTTDRNGNLWFAQGNGTTEAPLQIEMIPFAGTTSSVKLSGTTLNAPPTATGIRDLIFDSGGNLYVSFLLSGNTLSLYKYASNGLGGFQTGTSVGSFGGDFTDYGGGRLNLSPNELFVTAGTWHTASLYSMRLSDGTVTSAQPGTNVIGPTVSFPASPNLLLYSAPDGVRTVSFNQATGAIGTTSTLLLTAATTGTCTDGLAYSSAAGRLYLSHRYDTEVRFATDSQLASAITTPPKAIADLGKLVSSGSYSLRDLAVVDPPAYPGVVQQGDLWIVDTSLGSVYQFRGSSKVSTFTLNTENMIGGVATDADANLYIAGTGLGVYRIRRGTNQVEWLLKPDEVAGSGLSVRDVAVASNGTLYVTYLGGNGRVDKFTPDGSGTYLRTTLGTTGLASGDRGNHHSWLTNNGNYLLTSARGENQIVAMGTSTGSTTSWMMPSGALAAEIALDPFTNEYVVFCGGDVGGAAPYRLYALSFNPTTGAFGTTPPIPLNTDTDDWVDGLAFDPFTGDLYMSVRYNMLVKATYAQYLLALAGTPFDIDLLPRVYTGGEVNIARDMVVTNRVPEPTGCVLFVVGAAGLLLARRRFRNQGV